MGKTSNLFKKNTKGKFHANMGTIKDRNGRDLKKQKILRRGGKNTQKNCTKKDLHDPDNHDGVITYLEPDILECEVKWALESITMNKASRGDGIPVELFQILKDDAVKVLHSICQQIWKTQQWPQNWKRSLCGRQDSKFLSTETRRCLTLGKIQVLSACLWLPTWLK